MNNRFVYIVVSNNIKRFINKCKSYGIDLHDLNYVDKNKLIVKIDKKDLDIVKRYNYYSEVDIYRKIGIDNIKEKIFKQKYFVLIFIICLVGMYFISNVIFKVNVIHSNKRVRELVIGELEDYGIHKYSYKKDFNELESIKNKILESNKDKLEWISITNKGMTVVVRIEERILDEVKSSNEYCNIISKSEAMITNIYSDSGEIIVSVNDIVKKDDVLISGNIVLNEENKGYTCASGKVMGKVWYNTNITVNREYQKKEYTGKKRFNFTFNNKVLRNTKYTNYEKEYLIKNRWFSIYKEVEYKLKSFKYNEKESLEKALLEVDKKYKNKLGHNGKIISKKIMSKNLNDKTINVSLFVVTEENIGKQVSLDIPKDSLE